MDKFARSLAEGFQEHEQLNLSLDPSLSLIEKKAGMDIFQPTPENIEKFVSGFVRGELKEFPKALEIRTFLNPTNISDAVRGYVNDANGNVNIKLHDKIVEIPFIIKDSELIPFDIIQMKGERALYSRENLNKVLIGISNHHDNPEALSASNPFLGTEPKVSPATDIGFLKDVLQIRDEKGGRTNSGTHYVTASEDCDAILEKTASIKEMTQDDYKVIEAIFTKKALDSWEKDMEKVAEEDISEERGHFKTVMEGIKSMPLRNIHTMKNGQKIHFPEKEGAELSMTPAIVMKNINVFKRASGFFTSVDKGRAATRATSTMVITADGRYIVLPKEEPMFAVEVEETWKLKTTPAADMIESEIYTAVNGNDILFPFKPGFKNSRDVDRLVGDASEVIKVKSIECKEYPSGSSFSVVESPKAKFLHLDRDKFIDKLGIKINPDEDAVLRANLPNGEFYACDAATPVIHLSGFIKDYLRNPKELMFSDKGLDGLFKEASINSISLEVVSPERRIYDLKLQWKDNSKAIPSMKKKEFENVQEQKLQGILLSMGILRSEVAELVEKALANNRAVMDMPMSATPEKITGGDVEGHIAKAMSNFKNTVLSSRNMENMSTAILGEQLGEIATNSASIANILEAATKWASETEVLSQEFEKIATEYNSESILNIAKLMTASHYVAVAVKEACEGKDIGMFKEACTLVESKTECLEKIAFDLIALKAEQYLNNNQIISPNLIHGALGNIDRLFKVANAEVIK